MSQDNALILLQEGIATAKSGNKVLARRLLLKATELDPGNELGWMWLAGVAESPQEAVRCLQQALVINPVNENARRGLQRARAQMAQSAPPATAPVAPPTRPVEQPAERPAVAPAAARQQAQRKKEETVHGVILVVDDSPTVLKLVSITLGRNGYRVVTAADGLEALAEINDELPDLVLLDITMPKLDGYQLCKLIKGHPDTKDIPVIMLSGKDGFFDKVRGRVAGAAGYITKPFKPDELVKVVERYFKPKWLRE